ncbi:hypothetical protein Tco_0960529, partial [Tanacetum coccineum]
FKSSKSNKSVLKSVDLFGLGSGPKLEKKLKYTEQVCTGVILAKELIAATYSDVITVKILDMERCVELIMGSHIGVAAASTNLYDGRGYIDNLKCKDN